MSDSVELHLGSERFSYPILTGTENERAVDIAKLRDETGLITLDLAYKNTGATKSAITFIDGDLGILRYRGYPIEQLAEHSTFMEVSYLLLYGELPSAVQLEQFNQSIIRRTLVHENIKKFLDAYPGGTHPMGVLMSTIASLSSFYPNSLIPNRSAEDVDRTIHRLIAKMATIAAWTYKKAIGHPYMYPNNKYDYVSNFLMMMFGHRTEEYVPDPVVVDALNKLLILHADHEQNCSTSTVRIVGSSHANIYASVAAGIGALWGPLHGGANQAVIEMLEAIKEDGGDAQKYIAKAKDKNDPFRLMGFGHRVYKNFDPRAKIIKVACDQVLNRLGINDPILDIAKQLEETALSDEYFVERKLYPNVDFYSGIIYRAIGIPTDMFTVMFALGRLPGWISQWKEMRESNEPIGRPRQLYIGHPEREYIPVGKRKG
ncbi:MAG: citrate synthase [Bacteroidetes bacterium]|jgi:citrate synthase|nr:citrate synthase [Bacteroidota bacterium]